ncbi:MAG TPA: DsbA family protein [Solirubrobacterales bacterium]|nr:DsbA family protein [Solirubrobacterales bacterium]
MSSRTKQKQEARAARQDAERAEREAATRRRRLRRLGIVAALAVALVAATIAITQGGSDEADGDLATQAAEVESLLAGIPQDGISLGDPDAPVVMREFADPQCPFCADYSTDVFPEIVERYVRPGELRLEFDLLTFIGPDSERAARVAAAAAGQDRMWEFVDLLFANQGTENSGWATDERLREIAEAAPGLDAEAVFAERDSEAVTELLSAGQRRAQRLGVDSTPSFYTSREGGPENRLEVTALDPDAFADELDALVGGGPGG